MRVLILIMGIFYLSGDFLTAFTLEGPKGWEKIDDPSQLPAKVKVLYVGPGKGQFTPSINLATEETKLPLEKYIREAKSYHERVSDSRVTRLGKITTACGEGEMLQIDRTSGWGPVRFLQAIVRVEQYAYVITATCLQEDFGQLSRPFLHSIRSFNCEK